MNVSLIARVGALGISAVLLIVQVYDRAATGRPFDPIATTAALTALGIAAGIQTAIGVKNGMNKGKKNNDA